MLANFIGTHTFTMTVFDQCDPSQSKSEDLIVVVTE